MSSRRGAGKGPAAAGNALPKEKGIESSGLVSNNLSVDQMTHDMRSISIDSSECGNWDVVAKKSKNRGGPNPVKPWASSTDAPKSWGHPDVAPKRGMAPDGGKGKLSVNSWAQTVEPKRQLGKGNPKPHTSNRGWEAAYMAPPAVVPPPLQHGWQWGARNCHASPQPTANEEKTRNENASEGSVGRQHSDDSDNDELVEDTDDDISDDDDSDASQKSFETRKKGTLLRVFFEQLDKLTIEEINEPTRQWHCPACQNGPGAIDWYRGLQPLTTHAKTKGSKRVKLHREFAELLDEELQRRGTSVIPSGEAFGKWKGLRETADHEIVWPPMAVIMNTLLDKDEDDKWLGMGNQELLEYFSTYAAVKARHSYGPHGHRGMSVLLFEASAVGYLEAERLHKHFVEQGTDRAAWDNTRRRVLFSAGGKRQLYGFLARKDDMDVFNQHSYGKSRLKYEMRSYQEMVVSQMKQMSEDNQLLTYFKNKVAKQQMHSKTLEESFGVVSQKLRETMEENRIVRLRTKIQHEENKEEMDFQEEFFKEQMAKVHKATEEKERIFEKLLQEERSKAKQCDVYSGNKDDYRLREEEIARFIDSQVKEVEEFETEREKLIHAHEEKKVELKRRHLQEDVELEKEFDDALTKLMEKYTPGAFEEASNSMEKEG